MANRDSSKHWEELNKARTRLAEAKKGYRNARKKLASIKLVVTIAQQRMNTAIAEFSQAETYFKASAGDNLDWRSEANEIADGLSRVLRGMQERGQREINNSLPQEPQATQQQPPEPRPIQSDSVFSMLLGLA